MGETVSDGVVTEANQLQKEYYESKAKKSRRINPVMRAWERMRRAMQQYRKDIGARESLLALHREWLGDLSDCSVLDLGCYSGNLLSVYLATNARRYVGIDLSEAAVSVLRNKIADIPTAEAIAIDFLAPQFDRGPFDVIYAFGVLHHFRERDRLIATLRQQLTPGGRVVAFDPLLTSVPVRFARWCYRPFQSNASWEWPFDRSMLDKLEKSFDILDVQGYLGLAKYPLVVAAIPGGRRLARSVGQRLHRVDLARCHQMDGRLRGCMSLALHLRAK